MDQEQLPHRVVTVPNPHALPSSNNKFVWLGAIALIALSLAIVSIRGQRMRPAAAPRAATFTLTTFDGAEIDLQDWRGKVIVINFWASWCAPCRDEADLLEQIWRTYRERDVQFVGINYADSRAAALAHIAEFAITYPNGADTGKRIAQMYRVRGVPETFVVDRAGNLVKSFIGPPTETELRAALERALR